MTILSTVEDAEQVEVVYTAGWNVKIVQPLQKTSYFCFCFAFKLNIHLRKDPPVPLLDIYLREKKYVYAKTSTQILQQLYL